MMKDWRLPPYDWEQGKDSCFHHSFQHSARSSSWSNKARKRKKKGIKSIQIREEETELSLSADAMVVYVEIM